MIEARKKSPEKTVEAPKEITFGKKQTEDGGVFKVKKSYNKGGVP